MSTAKGAQILPVANPLTVVIPANSVACAVAIFARLGLPASTARSVLKKMLLGACNEENSEDLIQFHTFASREEAQRAADKFLGVSKYKNLELWFRENGEIDSHEFTRTVALNAEGSK